MILTSRFPGAFFVISCGFSLLCACNSSSPGAPVSIKSQATGQNSNAPTVQPSSSPSSTIPTVGVSGPNGEVTDDSPFGAKDSRGAYQEAHIPAFLVKQEYFLPEAQIILKQQTQTQIQDKIWGDSDPASKSWGQTLDLNFQDGELKTENPDTKGYRLLDKTRTYATTSASISFDNEKQTETGIYTVSGIVTLVTGETSYGPLGWPAGKPEPGFEQSSQLSYTQSGFYRQICNPRCDSDAAFNQFGNGKKRPRKNLGDHFEFLHD